MAETIGERYLTETRGIPWPDGGWPDCVRFLPDQTVTLKELGADKREISRSFATAGALIVAATLPDGSVTGVQRVYLTADAENLRRDDGDKLKLSLGVLEGAAARLPGPSNGPLLLAEGLETGVSLWVATGHETLVALGSLSNLRPPTDRRVVLCRDDDPQHSPADKALAKRLDEWRAAGCDVVVATPWPERRGDKSDFNDVIRAGGAAAVRARIAAVLDLGPAPPRQWRKAGASSPMLWHSFSPLPTRGASGEAVQVCPVPMNLPHIC